MQALAAQQANAETVINENFAALEHAAVYGKRPAATTGLTWGYYGGRWSGFSIADGTLTLTNGSANHVVVNRATGVASVATSSVNWDDTAAYARVYKITTSGGAVTAVEDHRAGLHGIFGLQLPGRQQVATSAALTFALSDMRTTQLHPSADTTARTWTIPANASVAFPINAELELINQNGAGTITLAITTDTLRLQGSGATGSRSLAANGVAWARKLTATEWLCWGYGLT